MFEIDESSLPFVRTRHALIAIDLQNDFISADATLSVPHPPNFVDNISNLASNFRGFGNIIWVRTLFEASRPVNVDGTSEIIITDAELPVAKVGGDVRPKLKQRPSQKLLGRFAKLEETSGESSGEAAAAALPVDEKDQISEAFLTLEPGQIPHVVSQSSTGAKFSNSVVRAIDLQKDLIFQKTWYSAFKDGSLVQTLRAKFVTEIYICGALTNIGVYATAMDAARHGYAITIVDDCLGYRSKARHDEALRNLVEFTGCDIVTSTDLIRDIKERERASRVSKPPPRRNPRSSERTEEKNNNLDDLMASLKLRPEGSTASRPSLAPTGSSRSVAAETRGSSESPAPTEEAGELKLPTRTPSTEVVKERVRTKIKTRRRPSRSGSKGTAAVREPSGSSSVEKSTNAATSAPSVVSSQASRKTAPILVDRGRNAAKSKSQGPDISRASLESGNILANDEAPANPGKGTEKEQIRPELVDLDDESGKMAKLSIEGEQSNLCEGDTTIIEDLLEAEAAENIFERVRDEVSWTKMTHQGGDVPRLVAVQGEIGEDGSIPIYRHPADEPPPLLPFTPVVWEIRKRVEDKLGHSVNHVLIQFYRDGNDYISEHSDKTLDIVPETFIANVSLGARRVMVFRTKKPQKPDDEPKSTQTAQPRQATRAPLPHNSMCRMSLVTNMRWLHGIRQDKRLLSEKTTEELAFDGGRISLTFRSIGTFLSKDQTRIWGQGATSKSRSDAKKVINGNEAESERMIRAFGKENRVSEFDWKEHYGEGFNVLHIENSPKLFLSGDKVADLRVELMLAEYAIEWTEGKLSPAFHWKGGDSSKDASAIPEILPVRFVDNDLSKSAVVGDMAIMLYLDAVYGSQSKTAATSQPGLAQTFSRFQQSGELLKKWRSRPFSAKPFRLELELWNTFAAEASFIAGEKISLADYALWPLLEELQTEWGTFDELRNLATYHKRLKESSTFAKVVGVRDEKQDVDKQPEDDSKPEKADSEVAKTTTSEEQKPNAKNKKAS